MGRNLVETVMGAVVLLIAGFFLVFAWNSSDLRAVSGYPLEARFNSIDGLAEGNDVRIGGVRIGSVTGTNLDPKLFQAVITMTIRQDVKLPKDTRAVIRGDGLLGGKYVKLIPGSGKETLAAGARITKTEDVVAIEELLGKAIFLLSDEATGKE